jgi:hypothetical protein
MGQPGPPPGVLAVAGKGRRERQVTQDGHRHRHDDRIPGHLAVASQDPHTLVIMLNR